MAGFGCSMAGLKSQVKPAASRLRMEPSQSTSDAGVLHCIAFFRISFLLLCLLNLILDAYIFLAVSLEDAA
jgi:hypothetical protein